ncbi:MAG TPA: hypothetical protein DDZ55_04045 [Firmicutes bacterium]|nr:hypothetical protein [Bacillota bacterium]
MLFTLLLYTIGPFAWVTYKPFLFYSLQIFYISFFVLGYIVGVRSPNRAREWSGFGEKKLLKILTPLLVVSAIFLLINMFREHGYASFDFSGLYKDIISGLTDMGEGYVNRNVEGENTIGGLAYTAVYMLWSLFDFNVILLGILYFKKGKRLTKIFTIICCAGIVMHFMSIGTNIGVFRIILAIFIFYAINKLNNVVLNKSKRVSMRKIYIAALVAVIAIVVYFKATMKSRGGDVYFSLEHCNIGGIGINRDSICFKIFPEELYMLLVSLSSYFTQGLYGFSLCTEVPWTPMFGFGMSYQVVDMISDYLWDIEKYTFQFKVQEIFSWSRSLQWASAYSWMANDVSLYGVVIIMFILGFFLAKSFKASLTTSNPFAKIVLFYLTITCIFLPCNYQIMQSLYTLPAFIMACICWLCTTKVKIRIR